jgi:hypothetical protein
MGVARLVAVSELCRRARPETAGHVGRGRSDVTRREWNALRVGDHVLVHDDSDEEQPIVPGRVITVEPAPGTNDVGIRISPARGRSKVAHPRRFAVHPEELDPDRHCWRCDTHARSAAAEAAK